MSQTDIRQRFGFEQSKPVRYSFTQKLRAFTYHVYMVILGPVVNRKKYDEYMGTFYEFLESKKKNN